MHLIPVLRLRVPEETERDGIDQCEMGEFAYDYVGLETELEVIREALKNFELRPIQSDD
jgi:ammonium transporter, Amt family